MISIKRIGIFVLAFSTIPLFTQARSRDGIHQPTFDCSTSDFDKFLVESANPLGASAQSRQNSPRLPVGARVITIEATIQGQKRKIKYTRYPAKKQPSRAIFFHLCGGPGVTCVERGLPPETPLDVEGVAMDYIGLGQNSGRMLSGTELSIEAQGEAVAAIVQDLKSTDVVLYGQSFGTSVATVAGAELSKAQYTFKPRSILLVGVLGDDTKVNRAIATERIASRAWALLSKTEKTKFVSAYDRLTRGQHPDERRLIDGLVMEPAADGVQSLVKNLRTVANRRQHNREAVLNRAAAATEDFMTVDENRQYRATACQINPYGDAAPSVRGYFNGRVLSPSLEQARVKQVCTHCRLINHTFDPAQFPIRGIPVLYVNSDTDVATPIEGARYHFESQTQATQKFFLEIKDGGHAVFPNIPKCANEILNAAITGDFTRVAERSAEIAIDKCSIDGRREPGSIKKNKKIVKKNKVSEKK